LPEPDQMPTRDSQAASNLGGDGVGEPLTSERGRLLFLARVSETLLSSLDYQQTLQHLSDLAVPQLGDWCAVDMVTADGSFARLAVTHSEPEKVRLAHEIWRRHPPQPSDPMGLAHVVRSGQPELVSELSDELLVRSSRSEEELQIARSLGLRSYVVMPLLSKGRVLGAVTLVHAESGRRYEEEHLGIARDFARLAAIAVDNAQLFRRMEEALSRERTARSQAESLVQEVMKQSQDVERLLLQLRADKETAERRVAELEAGGVRS
jgi:GAF domain-containing protein